MHGSALRIATFAILLGACKESTPEQGEVAGSQFDAVVDLQGRRGNPFDPSGRAIVLVFVTTECPISNRYAPAISSLATNYRERNVDVHLVYPDPDDDEDAIRRHLDAYDLPASAWRDPEHELVSAAGVSVTPEAAVFSGSNAGMMLRYRGRIDDRAIGFGRFRPEAQVHDLTNAIDAVLDGHDVEVPVTKAVGCYIADLRST